LVPRYLFIFGDAALPESLEAEPIRPVIPTASRYFLLISDQGFPKQYRNNFGFLNRRRTAVWGKGRQYLRQPGRKVFNIIYAEIDR